MSNTLDEDYTIVAQREGGAEGPRQRRPVRRWAVLSALAAFGLLLGVSALETVRDRPDVAAERAQLVDQIHAREGRLDALHSTLTNLQDEVTALQRTLVDGVTSDQHLADRLTALGVDSGTVAVTGPGVVITVDDAAGNGNGTGGTILDTDLQALVNGLWQAGAEAVAINGHRLTSLTSIRFAGQAITVDYRSLTPPYVVEAVGDPDTLPARLLETTGGQIWLSLHANFRIRFDTGTAEQVTVPADPRDHLLYARAKGGGG